MGFGSVIVCRALLKSVVGGFKVQVLAVRLCVEHCSSLWWGVSRFRFGQCDCV